jgi:hypothetical protein
VRSVASSKIYRGVPKLAAKSTASQPPITRWFLRLLSDVKGKRESLDDLFLSLTQ